MHRLVLAGALSIVLASYCSAQNEAVAPATVADAAGKMRAIPFHGVIASVDDKARSFAIAGRTEPRTLKITETTVLSKGGQPATLKDVVISEEVRGSYYKLSDGSLEAKTVKLGPLTESEKAEREARKEKRAARNTSPSSTP